MADRNGKHTQGEWEARGELVATPSRATMQRLIAERKPVTSRRICVCEPSAYMDAAECAANARLIAAAPDLLAALEGILPIAEAARHAIGLDIDQRILMDDARAAVAKAKPVDVATLEVPPLED